MQCEKFSMRSEMYANAVKLPKLGKSAHPSGCPHSPSARRFSARPARYPRGLHRYRAILGRQAASEEERTEVSLRMQHGGRMSNGGSYDWFGQDVGAQIEKVMRSTDHVGGEHGGRPRDAVSRACKPHCDVALVQIQNMHVKLAYDWFGLDAGAQIEKGHRGRRTMCVVDMTGVQETRLRGLVCRICVVALVQIQNMLVKLACQR